MTNKLKIEVGDTVRIAKTSGYYNSCFTNNPMCEGVVVEDCGHLDVDWDNGLRNTYQSCDLILIKKGKAIKKFTKSDLKTGMFVKHRDGDYAVVLDNDLSGLEHYVSLDTITPKLISSCLTANDIMFVYVKAERCCMNSHLSGLGLRRVWERTEQTPAQKEMEVLQVKMNESQAKMNELQAQMKVVQAKL
jgi:hypothetical protein